MAKSAYLKFLGVGARQGAARQTAAAPQRAEDPDARQLRLNIETIEQSGLFDATFYASRYPDLKAFHGPLVLHFLTNGGRERRLPNPHFDTEWYLATYPDVAASEMNPLLHYIRHGEQEGRSPCAYFDPAWYRQRYNIPTSGRTVLAHYLSEGQKHRLQPNLYFDPSYYLERNPDVAGAGLDPLTHFMTQGYKEDRNPSAHFNTAFYRNSYLLDANINPLVHYLQTGARQGLLTVPAVSEDGGMARQIRRNVAASPRHEERDPLIVRLRKPRARLFAFYLPQFHAIPENDAWWGRGFTEWRNVARAMPRFVGHYQPRIPSDLGHYDLTHPDIMRKQIELARASGIEGFCFYFYWFDGKRLLEKPVERFLGDRSLDMPFCLMWANENWTRRWDGLDEDVLIEQSYREDDEERLLADLARHFADPRYLRVDGRPLFIVYRPGLIPDAKDAFARWREIWRSRLECDPLLVMVQGFGDHDPEVYGLDGAVEFPPHKLGQDLPRVNDKVQPIDPQYAGTVHNYSDLVARSLAVEPPRFPLIRTVVPSWDNEARRHGKGTTFHGATPQAYERWLSEMVEYARRTPFRGEPLVFVNAWNEWAEAAYLEPDVHYGSAFLNATARALTQNRIDERLNILLVGHDAHPHGSQMLLLAIATTLRRQFGVRVAVALLDGGPLLESYRGIAEVHMLPSDQDGRRAVLKELARDKFRHAITNTTVSGRLVPLLKDLGIGVISLVHELPRLIEEYKLADEVDAIARHADKVVFASRFVLDGFQSVTRHRIDDTRAVIRPQGTYTEWRSDPDAAAALRERMGMKPGGKLVINVGYGDFRKGFDIFLSVAKLMVRLRDDVHFAWVGKTSQQVENWLLDDLNQSLLKGRLHMLGHLDEPVPAYEAADVFFLSSREDPFPTVIMEAFRAGLPVVALEGCGGFADIVRGNGRLVDRADIAAMAAAINDYLAAMPYERTMRAERLQRIVAERFRFDDYCHDLLRLQLPQLGRISVIVPNYNYARYLPDRLDSVQAQTYPVFETIVLDDKSTDDSLAVLESYREQTGRRLHLVTSESNSGSGYSQWDRGFAAARGDFIWIAEADDQAKPTFLEEAMALMSASDAAFVFCDSEQIDEHGKPLGTSYRPYFDTVEPGAFASSFLMPGAEFARRFLSVKNLVLNVSGVLWRRTALERALTATRDRHKSMRLACDWLMYLVAATECGSVGYVARPLNVHRRHSASVTHALDGEQHLAEVAAVHDFAGGRLRLDAHVAARMKDYRTELKRQFGLLPPAVVPEARAPVAPEALPAASAAAPTAAPTPTPVRSAERPANAAPSPSEALAAMAAVVAAQVPGPAPAPAAAAAPESPLLLGPAPAPLLAPTLAVADTPSAMPETARSPQPPPSAPSLLARLRTTAADPPAS